MIREYACKKCGNIKTTTSGKGEFCCKKCWYDFNKIDNRKEVTFELRENEIFKDIEDFIGLYKISNFGRVLSLEKGNSEYKGDYIKKTNLNHRGYEIVGLYNGKKSKTKVVHRLVAEAFIPNPENKPQVNHKDGNKQNNNDWNLEWNTGSENIKHAFDFLNKIPHNKKFTKDEIFQVLEAIKNKVKRKLIIKKFNIPIHTINDLRRCKVYKNWILEFNNK